MNKDTLELYDALLAIAKRCCGPSTRAMDEIFTIANTAVMRFEALSEDLPKPVRDAAHD